MKKLDYDSPQLILLKKWIEKGGVAKVDEKEVTGEKDTPINCNLKLFLDMDKSRDAKLLQGLASFTLPPFNHILINHLS
jgi:hypothetical protein